MWRRVVRGVVDIGRNEGRIGCWGWMILERRYTVQRSAFLIGMDRLMFMGKMVVREETK